MLSLSLWHIPSIEVGSGVEDKTLCTIKEKACHVFKAERFVIQRGVRNLQMLKAFLADSILQQLKLKKLLS